MNVTVETGVGENMDKEVEKGGAAGVEDTGVCELACMRCFAPRRA